MIAISWTLLPLVRAYALLRSAPSPTLPPHPRDLAVGDIRFRATDGTALSGWWVPGRAQAATIILVAGFKATRLSMLPYARFLHHDGYNVLLYDSRGVGASSGTFSLGLREVDDVLGAVAYVGRRPGLRDRRCGVLGVSLGSGVAIVAAARSPRIAAVVADSPYADQQATVTRLDTLALGPLHLSLAPLAPWAVDRLLSAPLSRFSPLRAAAHLAPRGLLLIHSRYDRNPTTPLAAALAIRRAAGAQARLWIAPMAVTPKP